jgi:DNA-binding transcriptional MocR family regulator
VTAYDGFAFRKAIRFTLLSTGAVAVAHDLATYADNGTGKCFPTQEQLAQGTGLSVRSVRRVLAELKDAGLIHVEKNKARDFNANSIYWCRVPVGMQSKLKAEVKQRAKSARTPASVPAPPPPMPSAVTAPAAAEAVSGSVSAGQFPTSAVWLKGQ